MKLDGNKDWSDEDAATVRAMWFDYKSDIEIGEVVHRSARAVQGKRRALSLLNKFFPGRQNRQGTRRKGARSYSVSDNLNILTRINNRETVAQIALDYGVSMNAMGNKVDRLLLRKDAKETTAKIVPTKRKCLKCTREFLSVHPKSTHRRCPECQTALNEGGESFLTMYG